MLFFPDTLSVWLLYSSSSFRSLRVGLLVSLLSSPQLEPLHHLLTLVLILTSIQVKLPFPLTIRFKSMLQSGVATRDLDVRWVSSLSWYFLNLFGLQSVFIFILGNDNAANQMTQQMSQMSPGATGAGFQPGQDPDKIFKAEAENLEVLEHWCVLQGIEERVLNML